jgi:hypothetical protein
MEKNSEIMLSLESLLKLCMFQQLGAERVRYLIFIKTFHAFSNIFFVPRPANLIL